MRAVEFVFWRGTNLVVCTQFGRVNVAVDTIVATFEKDRLHAHNISLYNFHARDEFCTRGIRAGICGYDT